MARVVGIDALKTGASTLLREVESGESIVVSRSGRAVARLVPEEGPGGLTELIRQGRVSWNGRGLDLRPRHAVPAGEPTLADVVIADRGPR
jgi:prevent-host-death family protein